MSRIKGKDTKPEMLVRKFLFSKGLRYRLHKKNLPGKPDLVLTKYNAVVFVNGCFWNGHNNCKYFVTPKTRSSWWINKINRNKENDVKSCRALRKLGWRVFVIYECELKPKQKENTLVNILKQIKVGHSYH